MVKDNDDKDGEEDREDEDNEDGKGGDSEGGEATWWPTEVANLGHPAPFQERYTTQHGC